MIWVLAAATSSVHETEQLVSFTLVELLVILAAARLAGENCTVTGTSPAWLGRSSAAWSSGPSLFGRLFPDAIRLRI